MTLFTTTTPTLEAYWRSIILFGANVASYKFALSKALLEFANQSKTFVSVDELAIPFAHHIAAHLKIEDKQTTSNTSKFLDACRAFNRDEISHEKLVEETVRRGFNNVIDAFHVVNYAPISTRFFIDERRSRGGITLTDNLLALREQVQYQNLPAEVEARWRLVETAWAHNISANLLAVTYDELSCDLVLDTRVGRRISITSARDALNGYQQGQCFYCFADMTLSTGSLKAHIDHFFPHCLKPQLRDINIDGVWNLVLACPSCNSGVDTGNGKSARIPTHTYLERLHQRNTYLIESHHPLRETIIRQTGATESARHQFLNRIDREAITNLIHRWSPAQEHKGTFAAWANDSTPR